MPISEPGIYLAAEYPSPSWRCIRLYWDCRRLTDTTPITENHMDKKVEPWVIGAYLFR